MVEVFITDIQNKAQKEEVLKKNQFENVDLKINFDINETDSPFPCGNTILRVEGNRINSIAILKES